MKDFRQYISEEKEIKVGGYQTTHHYMCPSAVKFIKKHMRMDHDMQDLEDIARLSDDVFKIEAEVEKSGKVSDKQIKSAQRYHTRRGMATMPAVKPECPDFSSGKRRLFFHRLA